MGEDPDTVRGDTTPEPQRLPNQPMTHYATMPQKINGIADIARLAQEIISGLRNTGKTDKMKETTKDQHNEVLTMNPKSKCPGITELARIAKISPKNAQNRTPPQGPESQKLNLIDAYNYNHNNSDGEGPTETSIETSPYTRHQAATTTCPDHRPMKQEQRHTSKLKKNYNSATNPTSTPSPKRACPRPET